MTAPSPPASFFCPRCGNTSHNPHDVAEGYCGNCHDWTGQRRPGYARHVLKSYLNRLGIRDSDAYVQLQHTMLLDMLERLEAILNDERVDPATGDRILRTLIYGCLPHKAEAEFRQTLSQAAQTAMSMVPPMPRIDLPPRPDHRSRWT